MKVTAIILAAGNSTRFNGNKMFAELDGGYIIQKTLDAFLNCEKISDVILTYNPIDKEKLKELNIKSKPVAFVEGGDTRTGSVKAAFQKADCDIVLIHDGARPYITQKIINDCIDCVLKNKSAVCAVPTTDTILKIKDGVIVENLIREHLYKIQTPQGFMFKDIFKAYKALDENESYTDDSQVFWKLFGKAHIFLGSEENTKITYKSDLK